MESIAGDLIRIRYEQKESGFAIVDLRTSEGILSTTGFINLPILGEHLSCQGATIQHAAYGKQFEAAQCVRSMPTHAENWVRFLVALKIEGLSHTLAEKMVERWPDAVWDILLEDPLRLTELQGITAGKALQICQLAHRYAALRELACLFDVAKIPAVFALQAVHVYKEKTVSLIRENPFLLTEAGIGLSFREADRLAVNLGIHVDETTRHQAAMRFVLASGQQDGHTAMTAYQLAEGMAALLDKPMGDMEILLAETLTKDIEGIAVYTWTTENGLVERFFFLEDWLRAEESVAKALLERNNRRLGNLTVTENWFTHFELMEDMTLAPHQKEAIQLVGKRGVCFITGGPGTGKTTLIRALVQLAEDSGLMPVLAAPTGKAVKRMQAATGYEARTIHRLLEVGYDLSEQKRPVFRRHQNNPIDGDMLIIDEASMVDVQLMAALLEAMPAEMRLVLVGDADQLPSVGPGQVLLDCLGSGVLPAVKLERVYRQTGESAILRGAWRILEGLMPIEEDEANEFADFQQIRCFGTEQTARMTGALVQTGIPEQFDFASSQIQVLSPMRKGRCGVQAMNGMLQNLLNPKKANSIETTIGKSVFRAGDRVMQTRNDYAMPWVIEGVTGVNQEGEGVFNGDTGQILEIQPAKKSLTVLFEDERQVTYSFDQAEALELAYAITVHKSQGCEYPVVVLPLSGVPDGLATRNLLYTAVTRARKLLVIVGSPEAVHRMVSKAGAARTTCLKRFLQEYAK